jgi:L-alanine-DL-glutamate epimerase-like enolase superfamily enzyme
MHAISAMRLRFASFPFPFRTRFEHAAASRDVAENVIVLAEDEAGRIGLGEGCPREYVTGETKESALAALTRWKADGIETVDGRTALEAWTAEHAAEIDANPSAFASVELALLDVFARRAGMSLERFLDVDETVSPPRVSAVYGAGSNAKFWSQLVRFHLYGMRDAKLKVSGDAARDRARARALACFGRVRVDANNLWRSSAEACLALAELRGHAWAAEEPLAARDFAGLAAVAAHTGLRIVLDESATHLVDLDRVVAGPHYVLNARVSKHGGLLRTLAMLRAARNRGFDVIVGAQVGETSILARAALVVARAAGDALVGFEAAYGLRLLDRDATTVSLGFRSRGRVTTAAIGRLGSGLTPTDEVLHGVNS